MVARLRTPSQRLCETLAGENEEQGLQAFSCYASTPRFFSLEVLLMTDFEFNPREDIHSRCNIEYESCLEYRLFLTYCSLNMRWCCKNTSFLRRSLGTTWTYECHSCLNRFRQVQSLSNKQSLNFG